MSHSITDNDAAAFGVPVVTPDILDTTYPATVTQALQALADRTYNLALTLGKTPYAVAWEDYLEGDLLSVDKTGSEPLLVPLLGRADYLRNAILTLGSKIAGLRAVTAQAYDEQISLGAGMLSAPQWAADFALSVPGLSQTDVAFPYSAVFPITAYRIDPSLTFGTCPTPRSIRSIRARVGRLGGAAHSAMPTTKRVLELCYSNVFSPATVVVASVPDPTASAAAYDAIHSITIALTSTQAVIDTADKMWFVRLGGESGANATSGHGLIDLRICYSVV